MAYVKEYLVYLFGRFEVVRRQVNGRLEAFLREIEEHTESVEEFRRLCSELRDLYELDGHIGSERDGTLIEELQNTVQDLEAIIDNNELLIDRQNEEIEKYKCDIDVLNTRLQETLELERTLKRQQQEQEQHPKLSKDVIDSGETDLTNDQNASLNEQNNLAVELKENSSQTILVTPTFDIINDLLVEIHQELESSNSLGSSSLSVFNDKCTLPSEECILESLRTKRKTFTMVRFSFVT